MFFVVLFLPTTFHHNDWSYEPNNNLEIFNVKILICNFERFWNIYIFLFILYISKLTELVKNNVIFGAKAF